MTTTHATPLSAEDLEVVHLIHSALRRDTERLADFAQKWRTADPGTHDALLLGWHGFSTELHTHHSVEASTSGRSCGHASHTMRGRWRCSMRWRPNIP